MSDTLDGMDAASLLALRDRVDATLLEKERAEEGALGADWRGRDDGEVWQHGDEWRGVARDLSGDRVQFRVSATRGRVEFSYCGDGGFVCAQSRWYTSVPSRTDDFQSLSVSRVTAFLALKGLGQ